MVHSNHPPLAARIIVVLSLSFGLTQLAHTRDQAIDLKVLLGSSWQVKNDVQIPNNAAGTRFSLADNIDEGPLLAARLEANWSINEKHGVRLLLAPLSYSEDVIYDETINFAGGTFNANELTESSYRFNSWRIGYHYSLVRTERSTFKIGGTLKIRDAEIRLRQGDNTNFDDDIGVVPLLYLAGTHQISERVSINADADALAGGPGRAIDVGVGVSYSLTDNLHLGAGLRILEGGADIDRLFNFAQFNSASVFLSTGF